MIILKFQVPHTTHSYTKHTHTHKKRKKTSKKRKKDGKRKLSVPVLKATERQTKYIVDKSAINTYQ